MADKNRGTRTISEFLRSPAFGCTIVVVVTTYLVLVWFRKGVLIAGGEWGDALFYPNHWLESVRYLWHDANGTGNAVPPYFLTIPFYYAVSFLDGIGIPMVTFQASLFWFLLTTGGLSVFFLVWHLAGEEKRLLASILASLFYLLNPFAQAQIWHRFMYTSMFLYASLPLILLLFILGLRKRRMFYALLISVVSFVFSYAYATPGYIIVPWLTIGAYLIFYLVSNRNKRDDLIFSLKFSALSLVLWFLTSMWWILPFMKTAPGFFYNFTSTSTNISSLKGVSQYFGLYYTIRLLNAYYFLVVQTWGPVYKSLPFQIVSWLIPLAVLFGLLANLKSFSAWYFAFLGSIGLFLGKGASPPLGSFYVSALKLMPFLGAFRGPFDKIGIMVALAYAFLFGVGLCALFYLVKDRSRFVALTILIVFVLSVLLIYPWPMWTGRVWPTKYASAEVEIPAYYKEADQWLSGQDSVFRTMHLPFIFGDGVIYRWEHGYNGFEPSHVLFASGSISRTQEVRFVDSIFRRIPRLTYTNQIWKIMALLNARYILLHYDLDFKAMNIDSPRLVEAALRRIRRTSEFRSVMSHDPKDKLESWSLWAPPGSTISWDTKDLLEGKATVKIRANHGQQGTYGGILSLSPPGESYRSEMMVRVWVKSNVPGKLLISLMGDQGEGISWDGRQDDEYSISADETGYWKPFYVEAKRATSGMEEPKPIRKILIALVEARPQRRASLAIGDISLGEGRSFPTEGIRMVRRFSKLSLYQLQDAHWLPRVYSVSQIIFSQDATSMLDDIDRDSFLPGKTVIFLKSQEHINKGLSQIWLKNGMKPEVSFWKINAGHYRVQVKDARAPFLLVLSETYSPDWKAYIRGREVRPHFIVNGYANAYYVNKKGAFTMDLEYTPIRLLSTGAVLSGLSFLLGALAFTVFPSVKRRISINE